MKVLHIDCSPREGSHSRQLSAAMLQRVGELVPITSVTRRDLGRDPIAHHGNDYATALSSVAGLMSADPKAFGQSETLITEVESSDIIILGTPMNNFTVPSTLKVWIDQLLRVGRTIIPTADGGKIGAVTDRPVLVGIASGGVFAGERANQPDFLTPYLTAALGCIGLRSVHYLQVQATAFVDQPTIDAARAEQIALIEASMLAPTER
jgi:FMN-dependent NADH-azoreductase